MSRDVETVCWALAFLVSGGIANHFTSRYLDAYRREKGGVITNEELLRMSLTNPIRFLLTIPRVTGEWLNLLLTPQETWSLEKLRRWSWVFTGLAVVMLFAPVIIAVFRGRR